MKNNIQLVALGLFSGAFMISTVISPLTTRAATDIDIPAQSRSEAEIMTTIEQILRHITLIQQLLQNLKPNTSSTGFTIQINDQVVTPASIPSTRARAVKVCLEYAYDPAYMWQLVTCTYKGKVIYKDVFIPG